MHGQFIVVDGYYPNPDFVRAYALSQEFNVSGNYPGIRTSHQSDAYFQNQKVIMEKIIGRKITYWPEEYNTAFQVTLEDAKTWVHYDATQWAAVIYLTPNAPIEAGTALFRHKESGIYQHTEDSARDFNDEYAPPEDWEVIAETKNIYNRAVIYNGNYYHSSVKPGFGTCKHTGRLFQTFFFDT